MSAAQSHFRLQKISDLKILLNSACEKESAALTNYVEAKLLGEKYKADAARMQRQDRRKIWSKEKQTMMIDSASMRMRQTWLGCAEEVESIRDRISRWEEALEEAEGSYRERRHDLDLARIDQSLAKIGGNLDVVRLSEMNLAICKVQADLAKKTLVDLKMRWL
ncbi:hypothetical protein G7Y79_00026g059410 [Physcia stellaris]|nr:hypothetical protein G7Y79_00026g059410 [Physcia stellaris]